MIDDIKRALEEYKSRTWNWETIRDPRAGEWLAALVEYYEAAENQGFDVWHRDLTNYDRLEAARKRLEGK